MLACQPHSHLLDFGPKSPVLTLASLLVIDELVLIAEVTVLTAVSVGLVFIVVRWRSETEEQHSVHAVPRLCLPRRDYWQHLTASVHFLQKGLRDQRENTLESHRTARGLSQHCKVSQGRGEGCRHIPGRVRPQGPRWFLPASPTARWPDGCTCVLDLMGLAARWLVASTLKKAKGISQVWHVKAAQM